LEEDIMSNTLTVWLYIQSFPPSTFFRPFLAASANGWTVLKWVVERFAHLFSKVRFCILTDSEKSGEELMELINQADVVVVPPGSPFQLFLRATNLSESNHTMFVNLAAAFGPDKLFFEVFNHHCLHSNAFTQVGGLPEGMLIEIYDNFALKELKSLPFPYQPNSLATAFALVRHLTPLAASAIARQKLFDVHEQYGDISRHCPERLTMHSSRDASIAMQLLRVLNYRPFPFEVGLPPFAMLQQWRELSLDRQRGMRRLKARRKPVALNSGRRCKCLFFVGSSAMSGGEQSLCAILEKLSFFGVDCHAVVPYSGYFSEKLKNIGIQVTVLEADPEDGDTESLGAAVTLLRVIDPDVVHFNGPHTCRLVSLLAFSLMLPIVIHVRIKVQGSLSEVLKRADRVIAISDFIRRDLERIELPEEVVKTVHNGIDDGWQLPRVSQSSARAKLGLAIHELILLTVARFDAYKRIEVAIDVLKDLRQNNVDARLLVLGERYGGFDDLYYTFVTEHAQNIEMSGYVDFLGFKADVKPYYEASDFLLATAEGEPFGRSLVEALAVELPVVASDSGGHREIIEGGRSGMLCSAGDIESFSQTIRRLIVDSGLRASLVKEGLNRARHFNSDQSAMKMAEIFNDLGR
jgi:glycosyltransferase involved in cell wall biosynthesis